MCVSDCVSTYVWMHGRALIYCTTLVCNFMFLTVGSESPHCHRYSRPHTGMAAVGPCSSSWRSPLWNVSNHVVASSRCLILFNKLIKNNTPWTANPVKCTLLRLTTTVCVGGGCWGGGAGICLNDRPLLLFCRNHDGDITACIFVSYSICPKILLNHFMSWLDQIVILVHNRHFSATLKTSWQISGQRTLLL